MGNYILMDDLYVVDLKTKKVLTKKAFKKGVKDEDSFTKSFFKISDIKIENIVAGKRKYTKIKFFPENGELKPIYVTLNAQGNIYEYKNENAKILGDFFLEECLDLTKVYIPNVRKMGKACFFSADSINDIDAKNVEEMGLACFCCLKSIQELNFPKLKKMRNLCFNAVKKVKALKMRNIERFGDRCFEHVTTLPNLYFPHATKIGYFTFNSLKTVTGRANIKNVKDIGEGCFDRVTPATDKEPKKNNPEIGEKRKAEELSIVVGKAKTSARVRTK